MLHDDPRSLGKPLTGEALGDNWCYRVGDYRIVVKLLDGILQILVIEIGHRRQIYQRQR